MTDLFAQRPARDGYAEYLAQYIGLVPPGSALDHLRSQRKSSVALFSSLSAEQGRSRYAEDKWSVTELLGHVIDTERMFQYRALSFGRGDLGPLPSFDQDAWSAAAAYDERPLAQVVADYDAVRGATITLFASFGAAQLDARGVAAGWALTTRSILYVITGHELHHLNVLAERYGIGA